MEPWFAKSILATVSIVPAFIAIPFFKFKFGIDPLVFLVWYFGATAVSIAVYWSLSGGVHELVPDTGVLMAIIAIGVLFGTVANGSLFQAVGIAPNPGLPPVIYASSSMIVFFPVGAAGECIARPVQARECRDWPRCRDHSCPGRPLPSGRRQGWQPVSIHRVAESLDRCPEQFSRLAFAADQNHIVFSYYVLEYQPPIDSG